jgi:hypothetical protein
VSRGVRYNKQARAPPGSRGVSDRAWGYLFRGGCESLAGASGTYPEMEMEGWVGLEIAGTTRKAQAQVSLVSFSQYKPDVPRRSRIFAGNGLKSPVIDSSGVGS